jgi:nucleoside-diphosphate-sugar epimerase
MHSMYLESSYLWTTCMIDVSALVQASLPPVKGQIVEKATSINRSASSGTMHVLEYARAANVRKIVHTSSFANILHPDDSWSPIVVTEDGKRAH